MTYAPELEWRLVAAWANYTWEAFCELGGERMSAHVAAYRTEKQTDALLAHLHNLEMRHTTRTPTRSR